MDEAGTDGMTRSIILGGIVGIVIGAIVTFALAHGLLDVRSARAGAPQDPGPSRVLPASDVVDLDDARTHGLTHRPLRPGSAPRGPEGLRATRS